VQFWLKAPHLLRSAEKTAPCEATTFANLSRFIDAAGRDCRNGDNCAGRDLLAQPANLFDDFLGDKCRAFRLNDSCVSRQLPRAGCDHSTVDAARRIEWQGCQPYNHRSAGGLTKTNGNVYYQLLALGTGSDPVHISNITINGSNNGVPSSPVAGVCYQNASGTVSRMAIYSQKG
jgi:hypothetical protein